MVDRLLTCCANLFELRDPRARLSGSSSRIVFTFALILALGVFVRFWGLGAVGLHGDEKTMALPTMQLVEHGTPRMPSGMFYARAVGQLYLMAASVAAFGQSEWALRLPSALCGLLLILLTWTAGRRFLEPAWNLALTAAVAFLPDFIDDSQTARMYVFLVTSVAGYMTLVFQWERTQKTGYLIAAVAVMIVGLQFHTLAIFAAFILLIPALLQGDRRRLCRDCHCLLRHQPLDCDVLFPGCGCRVRSGRQRPEGRVDTASACALAERGGGACAVGVVVWAQRRPCARRTKPVRHGNRHPPACRWPGLRAVIALSPCGAPDRGRSGGGSSRGKAVLAAPR